MPNPNVTPMSPAEVAAFRASRQFATIFCVEAQRLLATLEARDEQIAGLTRLVAVHNVLRYSSSWTAEAHQAYAILSELDPLLHFDVDLEGMQRHFAHIKQQLAIARAETPNAGEEEEGQ